MNKETNKEFEDIIRNKMSDKEFWGWVSNWKDAESIIEEALEWDEEIKKECIKDYKSRN